MGNKELIKKLNNLKSVSPDKEWKERNREILFSQISSSGAPVEEEIKQIRIFILPQKLVRFFSTPAWAVFFVCLIIISGSVFSVRAARLTKPDSSLYIARIISEKAQLAVTFGEEKKAKLSFKFANDHAKDITEILSKTDSSEEPGKSKTEKLSENFKKEMKVAKTKLRQMGAPINLGKEEGEEEAKVFSANLKKEEQGMQISEPFGKKEVTAENNQPATETIETIKTGEEKATNTPAEKIESKSVDLGDAHKVLEEAEGLFDEKDYNGVLDKLKEADNIVENTKSGERGEVKGASDGAATTTQN